MISLLTIITILIMPHTLLMVSPTEFCQSAQFPDYEVGIRTNESDDICHLLESCEGKNIYSPHKNICDRSLRLETWWRMTTAAPRWRCASSRPPTSSTCATATPARWAVIGGDRVRWSQYPSVIGPGRGDRGQWGGGHGVLPVPGLHGGLLHQVQGDNTH